MDQTCHTAAAYISRMFHRQKLVIREYTRKEVRKLYAKYEWSTLNPREKYE